ncbi:hypothetical protein FRC07_003579 [Ceratobasidium sp. 392]|nr:hypothetical protein FRC07_003579 [Ceratobasidium sp. 392]
MASFASIDIDVKPIVRKPITNPDSTGPSVGTSSNEPDATPDEHLVIRIQAVKAVAQAIANPDLVGTHYAFEKGEEESVGFVITYGNPQMRPKKGRTDNYTVWKTVVLCIVYLLEQADPSAPSFTIYANRVNSIRKRLNILRATEDDSRLPKNFPNVELLRYLDALIRRFERRGQLTLLDARLDDAIATQNAKLAAIQGLLSNEPYLSKEKNWRAKRFALPELSPSPEIIPEAQTTKAESEAPVDLYSNVHSSRSSTPGRFAGATKEEVDVFEGEVPHKAVPNVTVGSSDEEEIVEDSEPERQRELEDESSSEEEIVEDSEPEREEVRRGAGLFAEY